MKYNTLNKVCFDSSASATLVVYRGVESNFETGSCDIRLTSVMGRLLKYMLAGLNGMLFKNIHNPVFSTKMFMKLYSSGRMDYKSHLKQSHIVNCFLIFKFTKIPTNLYVITLLIC